MGGFFHTPKPKTFEPKPRFYDPEKEERDKLIRQLKAKHGVEDDDDKKKPTLGPGDFRKGMVGNKFSMSVQRRKSNTRLLVLVILLGLMVFFMLK